MSSKTATVRLDPNKRPGVLACGGRKPGVDYEVTEAEAAALCAKGFERVAKAPAKAARGTTEEG